MCFFPPDIIIIVLEHNLLLTSCIFLNKITNADTGIITDVTQCSHYCYLNYIIIIIIWSCMLPHLQEAARGPHQSQR